MKVATVCIPGGRRSTDPTNSRNEIEKMRIAPARQWGKSKGAMMRLRTILMTALLASLGLLPMALSTGIGAETQKPLAVVVIGGLVSATLLVLFVMPVLYVILARFQGRRRRATEHSPPKEAD